MKSITQTDLPNIRKKQVDSFDLLFGNKPDTDGELLGNIVRKRKILKSQHFYFVTALILFISACFLVVQTVANDPKVEKYKAIANNIEDINIENINIENNLTSKDEQISVVKSNDIPKVKVPSQVIKPQRIAIKKTETKTKVQEAIIVEIMLRPLVISSRPVLRGLNKNN